MLLINSKMKILTPTLSEGEGAWNGRWEVLFLGGFGVRFR